MPKYLSERLEELLAKLESFVKLIETDLTRKQISEDGETEIDRPNYRALSAAKELARVMHPIYRELLELRAMEGTVSEADERFDLLEKYGKLIRDKQDEIYNAQKQIIAERGSRQVDSGEDESRGKNSEARKKDGKDSRVRAEA